LVVPSWLDDALPGPSEDLVEGPFKAAADHPPVTAPPIRRYARTTRSHASGAEERKIPQARGSWRPSRDRGLDWLQHRFGAWGDRHRPRMDRAGASM